MTLRDYQYYTITWWFKVTFLGWLSDPFKGLSDLQLGDEKGTLNHLECLFSFFRMNFSESFRTPYNKFGHFFLSFFFLCQHWTSTKRRKRHQRKDSAPFFPGKSHKCLTRFGPNSLVKAWEKGNRRHVEVNCHLSNEKSLDCLMYVGNYTNY